MTEFFSATSSITSIAFIYFIVKYHNYWKLVLLCFGVAFLALILVIYFVSNHINKKNIEKALQTKQYDEMTGIEFENFCANILRGNDFKDVKVTKASADHGIDVLAKKDGRYYAIQCKRYNSNVGNKAVQEAYSGKDIYKADVAVVMTNQFFTKQAMQDARNLKVELWDRDKIYELQMAGMKKSEKEK